MWKCFSLRQRFSACRWIVFWLTNDKSMGFCALFENSCYSVSFCRLIKILTIIIIHKASNVYSLFKCGFSVDSSLFSHVCFPKLHLCSLFQYLQTSHWCAQRIYRLSSEQNKWRKTNTRNGTTMVDDQKFFFSFNLFWIPNSNRIWKW